MSGYVCCRNAVAGSSSTGSFSSPALDFNELAPASSIRDVRQQPQQFNGVVGQFSSYGQCGKRNAHGVTGRINNPAQKYNEGDTEFGEYPWQVNIDLFQPKIFVKLLFPGGNLEEGGV